MRYAETLLADGEHVILRRRQHWLSLFGESEGAIGAILLGLALFVVSIWLRLPPEVLNLAGWLTALLIGVGVVWLGFRLLRWWSQDYLVTNRRIVKVEGIVNKVAADSSLEKINDAILVQGVLGRLLGYADLDIMTAAETSIDRFNMLAGANAFKREMLNAKFALEGQPSAPPTSPPLRASSPTREETADLLARLADLRDRGAISPEEFEAKKRDLLERI